MTREELRQAVLAVIDAVIEPVPTPEWPAINGMIHVRTMTLPERTKYLAGIRAAVRAGSINGQDIKKTQDLAGVELCTIVMCNDVGETLMEEADIEFLAKKSWLALNRVVDAAARLNGLTPAAAEAAKNGLPSAATSASN